MTGAAEDLVLRTGDPIPRLGLGVFRIEDGEPVRNAVRWALEAGYRHVDTAAAYRNEAGVGRAIREGSPGVEGVFVTTKLWNEDHGYDRALRAFDASLDRLGLERVDLYLIHWPVEGGRLESWRALERIHEEGRARAIGVSNYMTHHLDELLAHCRIPPAVNQIELHPFNYGTREPVVDYCREEGIVVEAYSPLTKGRRLDEPTVARIAGDRERTAAQILVRYVLQKGVVALPKSGHPERIRENARVFDFRLDDREMAALDGLDEGYNCSWDPTTQP